MENAIVQQRLTDVVRPTTLISSVKLNAVLGVNALIATETFQHTGSFKFRAAYNVALNSQCSHLATVSSGNFGQALAYACQLLGKRCTVVMPSTSAQAKVDAVKNFGAHAHLVDLAVKSRLDWITEIAAGLTDVEIVSPYDDPRVIEGNSTLADELAGRSKDFDCVIVPIGGGGLSSGLVSGFKRRGITADIIGAEPLLGNDAARSLAAGTIIANEKEPMTLADGARTLSLGKHNWPILKAGLHSIIEVDEERIAQAVKLLFTCANLKVEPTGALSTGALLTAHDMFVKQNRRPLLIVSGGNVDSDVFAKLIT
jgi:threonine dehydratase